MSTCVGCWRDVRVPGDVGVLMGIGYEDGGAEDPYVSHAPTSRCPIEGGQPHRMTECGEFDPPRAGFEP